MKLKKNKFIIGLSTTVLGSALAAGSQVAYADEPVDISSSQTTGVSEPSEVSLDQVVDGSYLGGEEKSVETPSENNSQAESAENVDEPNSETTAESTEGAEQNSNDNVLANETEENSTNGTEETDTTTKTAENTEPASEATSEEAVLTEPSATTEDSAPVEKTEEPSTVTTAEEDTATDTDPSATEIDQNLDIDAGAVVGDADTASTAADPVDDASTEKAQASEENTESLNNKETADATNTEQKDDASISADTPLGEDGLSKTEESSELAETSEGATLPLTSEGAEVLAEENLEISEEKTSQAQKAPGGGESTEPNYAADEANIKDYKDEQRYRSTQMEQGAGTAASYNPPDEMDKFIDGYRYHRSEPSTTSEDKNLWGIEIEFDKKKSQRTYTDFYFSNSGDMGGVLDTGNVSANVIGDRIAGGEKDPNYKATSEIKITPSGRSLRNLNLYASEEDLKHINDINNTNTTMAWQGKYKKDNPEGPKATEGATSTFGFTVNPWPNENDKLSLITLTGSHDKIEFVQGQTIKTGFKVQNLDENARERLVGQVYHPDTGEVVEGAKAYIDENDNVVVKMPDGALKKDANGKTVINEDSIFNTSEYKNLQNLEVKFFARPRTKGEFEAIVTENGAGYYKETGAGTKKINHDGNEIEVDLQGIDRYDHYNLIGEFEIQLDDESNYDIITKDITADKNVTDKMLRLKAGVDKKIEQVDNPNSTAPHKYTTAKANNAVDSYLEEEYKDYLIPVEREVNKYRTEDNWLVEVDPDDPLNIKVSTPIGAKKGESLSLAVTHLFTNGSEKNFLIDYVVREESIEKPNYKGAVTEAGDTVTNTPTNNYTETKPKPVKYELESTSIVDDNGKTWTLSIDEKSGVITATAPGEIDDKVSTINAPVIATYEDQKLTDKDGNKLVYTERSSATFSATAPQEGEVRYSQDNTIEYETIVRYNPKKDPTESGVVQEGKNGKYTVDYKVTYKNGDVVDGPTMVEGTERDREEPIPQIFEIGTKGASVDVTAPNEQTIKIPYTTEIIYDENQPVGYRKETPGEDGEKKITYEITQQDGKATVTATETTTKEVTPRKIIIGTKPSELGVDFNPEIDVKVDDTKDVGSVDTEVVQGEYKTVTKNVQNPDGSIVTIEEVVEITKPKQIITVGTKDYTGDVSHTDKKDVPFEVKYEYTDQLDAGVTELKNDGVLGEKTVTYTVPVINGKKDPNKEITSEEIQTKDPVDKVILVGTRPVEKTIEIPFETEYVYDSNLEVGQTVTDENNPGVTGQRKVTTSFNQTTNDIEVTEETVREAQKRIVRVGGKTTGKEVITEDIAFNTRVEYDPSLKKGEWKYQVVDGVEQKGVAGVRTITVNIENSEATSTTEQVTAPVDAVILVGSEDFTGKISHDVTEATPYDVKVVYDPNMKAGEYKVETEGKAGSKTTRYTQAIKNGQADGDLQTEVITTDDTKDAVDEVIRVGTRVLDDNTQKESNVPVNVKFTPTDTIAQGTAIRGEYTPGKVVDKVVSKYNPETGKIESTITPEVTPAELEILVGTQAYTGEFSYVERRSIPFETEIRFDDTLAAGETRVDQTGVNGVEERTITQSFTNGTLSEQDIPENFTNVSTGRNKIVSVGTMRNGEVVHTEPIPFEVKVKYDPSLEAGEYKYETDADGNEKRGVAGEQSITYTIVNSEVTSTSQPNITKQAENAVILVGSKDFEGTVSHEVTREVPFEVEIQYDDTLKAGEYKVTQQGELGSETTKYEFNIKNGEAVDEKPTTSVVESKSKAPVKQIVKVGRKPAENTNDFSSEIGIDVKFVPDENKEQGSQPETTYTPGTVVNKVVNKYNPETGEIETTTEPQVTKGVIEIKYGTKDYTGEVKYIEKEYIDYPTKVTVDYSLKPNEVVVDTKGQVGIKERNVTQKVVNGKLTDTTRDEYKTTSQPVEQVIRIGASVTAEKPVDKTIEIPFATTINEDPTKPIGYKNIDTEGENGSVTITFSEEIKDGKVTVTANEDRKEPTTQVVTIGTKAIQNVNGEKEEAIKPVVNVVYDPELEQGKIETEVEDGKAKASSDGSYNGDTGEIDNNTDVEVTQPTITVTVGTKPINKTKTEEIPFETEYVFDPDLEVGQQETQTEGQNGSRTITFERTSDGTTITEKEIDVKVTEPTNKVVRVGTKQTVTTQEIETPYETEVRFNPELAVGEEKVIEKGTPGKKSVTVTTAIGKDGNPTTTTKENEVSKPTNRVVEIGTKCAKVELDDETIVSTKEIDIPFETQIVYSDTLPAGEQKVSQEGKEGKRTITVTVPIINGKAGDESISDVITVNPIPKIITIGTKVIEQEKPEAPKGDTKDIVSTERVRIPHSNDFILDDTLPEGTRKIDKEGEDGEVTIITTVKIEDGIASEPVVEKIITKEPVTEVIRIGTKKSTNSGNNTKPSKPTPPVSPTTQTITREIPYDTVFIYDNTIEAGKKVVTSPGQKGEKIVTVTSRVVNGKIVTETTEKITKQPKIEYVRVGTKAPKYSGDDVVTNESKVLIPFETEIIYDDTLPLGQTEVVSEGRDGIQVVTITTRYQNGLAVDTTTDGYVEREAINRVVRVGTKTDDQTPTIDENTGIIDIPTTTDDNDHIIVIPEGATDDENHVVVIPEEAENDEDNASKKNRPVNEEAADDQVGKASKNGDQAELVTKGTKIIKSSEDDANEANIKRSAVSSTNPKTGITGTAGIISTLGISLAGITASRKKKEDDEE